MGNVKGNIDPSERATKGLEAHLEAGNLETEDITVVDAELQKTVSKSQEASIKEAPVTRAVDAELSAERLTETSERRKVRVLFVSDDDSLFTEGSMSQLRMAEYSSLFEEVHVIVCTKTQYEFGGLKLRENVWVYPTKSRSSWFFIYDAYKTVQRELFFADTFRADVVGASNPFLVGCAGYFIARHFKRGFYLEILTNSLEKKLRHLSRYDSWRQRVARFLLKRADRIRVCETRVKDVIRSLYPAIAEKVSVLPFFADIEALKNANPEWDLHAKYPKFQFIMLLVADFIPESNIPLAIEASQFVLRQYESVGMILVGTGPEEKKIRDRIKAKNLQTKIIIEKPEKSRASYFKTANIFISTASDGGDIDSLISAAVSRLPIITSQVGVAADLFVHERSALLCQVGDLACFIRSINAFLSNNTLRVSCVQNAESDVIRLIEGNKETHNRLVRENIERAMVAYVVRTGGEEAPNAGN